MPSIYEAYKWNDLILIDEFATVAIKLGACGGNLLLDISAPDTRRKFDFLKGVLRARLEGHTPPFDIETKVKAINASCPDKIFGDPELWFTPGTKHALKEGDICTVHSVHYQGNGKWLVVLKEHCICGYSYFLYDAKDLAPVT